MATAASTAGLLLAACGGDDAPSAGEFCDGFAEWNGGLLTEIGLDPSDRRFQDMVEEMRGLDPPEEVSDDWGTVVSLFEAAEDFMFMPLDPESPEAQAVARVDSFVKDRSTQI